MLFVAINLRASRVEAALPTSITRKLLRHFSAACWVTYQLVGWLLPWSTSHGLTMSSCPFAPAWSHPCRVEAYLNSTRLHDAFILLMMAVE